MTGTFVTHQESSLPWSSPTLGTRGLSTTSQLCWKRSSGEPISYLITWWRPLGKPDLHLPRSPWTLADSRKEIWEWAGPLLTLVYFFAWCGHNCYPECSYVFASPAPFIVISWLLRKLLQFVPLHCFLQRSPWCVGAFWKKASILLVALELLKV